VALAEDVVGRLVCTLFIVRSHGVTIPFFRQTIYADYCCSALTICFGLGGEIAEVGWDYDQAGREEGTQFVEVNDFLGVIVVRVAE